MKFVALALLLMTPAFAKDWRTDRDYYRSLAAEARAIRWEVQREVRAAQREAMRTRSEVQRETFRLRLEAQRDAMRTRMDVRREMERYRQELRRELRDRFYTPNADTTGMHRIL